MGKSFNKGLDLNYQKEGLFKRIKNIEDRNGKQLKAIEDHGKKQLDPDSKSLKSINYFSQLSAKAKELFEKIKKEKHDIDPEKYVCVKTDGTIFNFNELRNSVDLASNIYGDKNLLKDAENKKHDTKIFLNKRRNYNPTKPKTIEAEKETLISAEKLLNKRQEVIDAFKTGIFPYIDGFKIKEESEEEESEEESKEKI